MRRLLGTTVRFLVLGLLVFWTGGEAAHSASPASSAESVQPLLIGATVPSLTLRSADGSPFDLGKAIGKQPTILIFYRGGW